MGRSTGGSENRRGFWMARLFPVDADSAIAELWHDDEVWADVRLEGVQLDAHGEDRITSATAVVRLYVRPAGADPDWREHRLEDLLEQLTTARHWLLDNERGRTPVDDGEELSAAGRALSTASARTIEQLITSVRRHPTPTRPTQALANSLSHWSRSARPRWSSSERSAPSPGTG